MNDYVNTSLHYSLTHKPTLQYIDDILIQHFCHFMCGYNMKHILRWNFCLFVSIYDSFETHCTELPLYEHNHTSMFSNTFITLNLTHACFSQIKKKKSLRRFRSGTFKVL